MRRDFLDETGKISAVREAIEIVSEVIAPKEFEIPTEEEGYSITGRQ